MTTRFLCFGELLLRLGAPGHERLLQTPQLQVHIGGAEANVAVALAHFGHDVAMASVIPRNALGAAARGELRRHGVDTTHVTEGDGRMGLYFLETGAAQRPSEVLYDRAHSAFANALAQHYDWNALLDGTHTLHVSGVTPALGARAAESVIAAVKAAAALGVDVVFDGNYRGKLWQAWDGNAPQLLGRVIECASIAFADHRDIGIILRCDFGEDLSVAAAAAFAAWPRLQRIACTQRVQHSVDRHTLSAHLYTRDTHLSTDACEIAGIVDRIGAGDAFAAGVLHGLRRGMGDQRSLRFGLAAGCLKHSLPGDFFTLGAEDVQASTEAMRFDVRR
jgi:2-dehydro-3-deoxygluconokinase